jgi:hypothetical protein
MNEKENGEFMIYPGSKFHDNEIIYTFYRLPNTFSTKKKSVIFSCEKIEILDLIYEVNFTLNYRPK